MRRWLLGFAAIAAAVAALTYYRYDPAQSAWFPRCVFLTLTGHQCPGCGSQRALHSLLHGDLAAAWRHNAAVVCAMPVLGIYLAGELRRKSWPRFYRAINHPVVATALLAAVALWWMFRQ